MWSARRLDIEWSDLAAGLAWCVGASESDHRVLGEQTLLCLSARSAFDLLLSALELPTGSEVLMSAVTVADMARIVVEHGLIPVPVDLDLPTLAPSWAALEAALTPNTRVFVVAHLFGSRVPLDALVEFARARNLFVIEDLAQGFAGWPEPFPSPADASLYSFGPIKSATAIGGGLARISDREFVAKIWRLQLQQPRQSRLAMAQRLLKYAVLKAVSQRLFYSPLVGAMRLCGRDFDRLFAELVRGFPGPGLLTKLRKRPSDALVQLLLRRLRRFDLEQIAGRAAHARRLLSRLEGQFYTPGVDASMHSHWAVPILSNDPGQLIAELLCHGFHATQSRSLTAIAPPPGRNDRAPLESQRLIREAVFLPIYSQMSEAERDRLASTLLQLRALAAKAPTPGRTCETLAVATSASN